MAAPLLGAVSGDRVLDACAAPGGKSCHILEHCPDVAELVRKQEVSNYVVTQMCFDAGIIGGWVQKIRDAGVELPVWIGLPSVSNRASLMTTSLRIGVGNSLRYLKNHGNIAANLLKKKEYRPDELLFDLAPHIGNPAMKIQGHHIYCFNQVSKAEDWRRGFLDTLRQD